MLWGPQVWDVHGLGKPGVFYLAPVCCCLAIATTMASAPGGPECEGFVALVHISHPFWSHIPVTAGEVIQQSLAVACCFLTHQLQWVLMENHLFLVIFSS